METRSLMAAVGLMLSAFAATAEAPPAAQKIVVLKNNSVRLQMAGKQPIQAATGDRGIVRIDKGEKDNNVLVTGLALGKASLVLTDAAGKSESFAVTIESNQLFLKIGSTIQLQLTTKEPIAQAINEKETVARISVLAGDPTSVLLTGLAPGITKITLVGASGRTEIRATGK